jgi:predicted Zn-dependent protease
MKFKFLVFLFILASSLKAQQPDVTRDIEMGKQAYIEVAQTMGFYKNPALETYLRNLGNKLVAQLKQPLFNYEFYLVDAAEPNAFAVPGGKVFITRGLLLLPMSEDELAGVIGHEIIHTQNRHSIQQQKENILGGLLALPGILVSSFFRGPLGEIAASPFIRAGSLINSQYSQSHETEADKQGVALAAAAGYKPQALAPMLKRLNLEVEFLTQNKEQKDYFSTHPYTPDRIKNINKTAEKLTVSKNPALLNNNEFLRQLNGLSIGLNPEYGFAFEDKIYHPQMKLQMDTAEGWNFSFERQGLNLTSKKGDAMVAIQMSPDSLSAYGMMKKIENLTFKKTGLSPSRSEASTWFGNKAAILTYNTTENGRAVFIQYTFVEYNNQLLKMVAMGYKEQEMEMAKVLAYLKPIKRNDLPQATTLNIVVSEAKEGESISAFAKRFEVEKWSNFIGGLNDKNDSYLCKKGELLKWIQYQPYSFQ